MVIDPPFTTRLIDGVNGLTMRVLEAGDPRHPSVLLLHGFPELAYSWRKIIPILANAGYHVIAPDQRGYGGTTGWDPAYDGDLDSFRLLNLVRDSVALLHRLGIGRIAAVIGHDFGASVAAWCALIRPDLFPRLALLSAPFTGPPVIGARPNHEILNALAALPRPRQHYQHYYSGRTADADMHHPPQGLAAFLRAYFHMKSADWPGNRPEPLPAWTAEALSRMPEYYIMDHGRGMAETVAPHDPGQPAPWFTDADLAVYAEAFARTGFQGGLQWYRCRTEDRNADLEVFAGRTVDTPALFIAGSSDWGMHQVPGALAAMRAACPRMGPPVVIEGAGHWVQQEQPERTAAALLELLA